MEEMRGLESGRSCCWAWEGFARSKAMGITPGVLHLNEGHSGFAVLEALNSRMQEEGSHSTARCRGSRGKWCSPLTHRCLRVTTAFDADVIEEHLGPLRDKMGLSQDTLMGLGREKPSNQQETFCMTVLGLRLSRRANAVSALHGEVSRRMWTGLCPGKPEDEVPIGHITNGVHVHRGCRRRCSGCTTGIWNELA